MKSKLFIQAIVLAFTLFALVIGSAFAEQKTVANVTGRTWFPGGTWNNAQTTSTQTWPYIKSDTRLWHLGAVDSSSTIAQQYNSNHSGLGGASALIWGTTTTNHLTNAPTGGYTFYTSSTGGQSTANWWACGAASC